MDINSLPKTELHVHVEAIMNIDTLKELIRKYRISTEQLEILERSVKHGYSDITDFFKNWHYLNGTLRTAEDFERVVYEYLVASSEFNAKYIELNVNVLRQEEKGLDALRLIKALYSAQKQAENHSGIISRTILSYSRDFSLEEGKRIVDMADRHRKLNVVGIDIAGNERAKPNKGYVEVFEYAMKKKVNRTAHAGEGAMQNSILDAIEKMKVSRIGHGIDAVNDENIMEVIKKNDIAVELCVSSNLAIGVVDDINDHPTKKFIDKGIKVVLNTDDPTLLGLSLNDEYALAAKQWNLQREDFVGIYRNGVESSFVEEEVKKELLRYA